jgi:pimeloyl-ACP methyl ester carboxylesterase
MTITRDHDLQLADGRVLRYQIAGTAHGDAVLLLHGALGSRLVHDSLSAAASDAGIRLVSYDRPGYGGSTPHPGRTVAAAADDVAAIADQLDVDHLAVWGQSGGGPFALACAALLPDRVAAAAAAAPLAPYQAPTLDWFAGMADDVAQMHRLAIAGRDALQQALPQLADVLTSADLARFVEFSSPTLPRPTRRSSRPTPRRICSPTYARASPPERRAASRTSWPWSHPGGSTSPASASRSASGPASRTPTPRPGMPAGLPTPSPVRNCIYPLRRATCRWSTGESGRSSTGSHSSLP